MAQIVRPRIGHGVILSATAFHGRKFDTCGAAVKWSSTPSERTKGITTTNYGGTPTNGLRDFEPDMTDEEYKRLQKIRRTSDEESKFWRTMRAEPDQLTGPRLCLKDGARLLTNGKVLKPVTFMSTRATLLRPKELKVYTRDIAKERKELGLE